MANAVSLLNGARLAGLSADLFHQIQHGSKTMDQLAIFLQGKNPFGEDEQLSRSNMIQICPNDSLESLIARTNQNLAASKILKLSKFNPQLIGSWGCRIIDPKGTISSASAKKLCEEGGWQAASLEHLLLYSELNPTFQDSNILIALGSECQLDGNRHVPELWDDDDRRRLDLNWWGNDWNPGCRFLSVRRISAL